MSLPLFKLGALFVKQLSKPLGKAIKEKATSNEKIRNYVVIPTAKGNSLILIELLSIVKFDFKYQK